MILMRSRLKISAAPVVLALVALGIAACKTPAPLGMETSRTVRYPILLLHGLGGTAEGWEDVGLVDFLCDKGMRYGGRLELSDGVVLSNEDRAVRDADLYTIQISDSFQNLDLWADELAKVIHSVIQAIQTDRVVIVAHSAGGVVSRKYLADHPNSHHVHRLVTIGSPHLGSELARMTIIKPLTVANSRFAILRPAIRSLEESVGISMDADAIVQLQPESTNPWLTELNRSPHPRDVLYTSLVVELGNQQPVLRDLREVIRTIGDDPTDNPAISRQLNRLLGMLNSSPHDTGDGVVLAESQRMSRIEWFKTNRIPVEEIRIRASSHTEARKRSSAILAAIAGEPGIVSINSRRRPLSSKRYLDVDIEHELAGLLEVQPFVVGSHLLLNHSSLEQRTMSTENGVVFRVTIGPLKTHEIDQLDLDVTWPTASEVYVASAVNPNAVYRPSIVPDTSDATVQLRIVSATGIPNKDKRLFDIGDGSDVVLTVSSGERELIKTDEVSDVLEGSVFWDKRFDLSLNPLRDDLVFQIWDLDPFDRELLGEVRWEPGEWPNESFKEMTETGIELVVGAYWVPVPLMHVLEEPFHWE